jgi:hypothetical protein
MDDIDPVEFIKGLEPEDLKRLHRLLSILRRIDGWCRVNRAIGRWFIFTVIAALVIVTQGYDAIIRLLGAIRGH